MKKIVNILKPGLISALCILVLTNIISAQENIQRSATMPKNFVVPQPNLQTTPVNPPTTKNPEQATTGRNLIYVIDQNQPDPSVYMAAFSQTDLAQSFKPSMDLICGAGIGAFDAFGPGSGDITISLWDNLPNAGGNLLATGTTSAALNLSWIWVDVFWPSITVIPGVTYYLVFTSTNGDFGIRGSIANPYPDGMVFANPGYGPFPTFDYTFRTYSCNPQTPLSNWGLILAMVLMVGTTAWLVGRRWIGKA